MTVKVAIDPTAVYIPREAALVSGISITEITAAIVRGDLRARLKPPGFVHRMILGADLLRWIATFPEA